MLITLIGGLIFVGVSYFVQIAHPSFQFDSVDSAAYEIARNIGGDLFVSIFLIGLIVSQFASGLSARGQRFATAVRHGPRRRLAEVIFRHLARALRHPGQQHSVVRGGGVAGAETRRHHLDLVHQLRRVHGVQHGQPVGDLPLLDRRREKGPRELLLFLLCPLIGLVADLWLMVSLDHLAVWLGLSWLAIGVVYLAVLTGGFRRQPPELDFQEAT